MARCLWQVGVPASLGQECQEMTALDGQPASCCHTIPSKISSPQAGSVHQGPGSKRKIPEGSGKHEKFRGGLLFPKNQASRKHRKLIWDVRYCKNIARRNALKANLWQGFSSCIRQLVGKRIAPSSSWPGLPFVWEVPLFLINKPTVLTGCITQNGVSAAGPTAWG